jgi:transposase
MKPKKIEMAAHLSVAELEEHYKAASSARDGRRWHVLWLVGQGQSIAQAAEVVGIHRQTAREIVKRYNEQGAEGVHDRRRHNTGQPPRLNAEQQGRLLEALRGRAPDGGLWTGPKVTEWIERETGRVVPKTLGWKYLKRVGARLLVPRRRHRKAASEDEQEAWQRAFARFLEGERQRGVLVGATVEVWAQDEARIGLKPVLRRVWVVGDRRPVATTHHQYEWLYVYGFVHPATGRTFWLILPTVDTEMMSLALEEFARHFGLGPRKRVLLVIDRAGWHISSAVRVPDGITLVELLPYTPELQPAERLWPLLNESIANDAFDSLDALEMRLSTRCVALLDRPEIVRDLARYHWWPSAA